MRYSKTGTGGGTMKETGWLILERPTVASSYSWRPVTMKAAKKDSIAAYERTVGSYLDRTGSFKTDHANKLAFACKYTLEVEEPKS